MNEFVDFIASDLQDLGCTDQIAIEIEIEKDAKPVFDKPYRLNAKDRKDLDERVNKYKEVGIVTETNEMRSL